MKITTIRVLEMLIRVRQFCTNHAASFPEGSRGAELLALVVTAITEIQEQASAQDSGKRAAKERTAQKREALKRLRKDLEAISRTGRAMALTMPGLADKFHLPKGAAAQEWLAAGRSIAGEAEAYKDEFMRRGMAASFREDLDASISALEEAISGKVDKTAARVSATVAVSGAADRGRVAVRELDAVVRNLFRGDPATLAEWESASHIERAARHSPAKPPTPPTPSGA